MMQCFTSEVWLRFPISQKYLPIDVVGDAAGHGPMVDLAEDPKNAKLISDVRLPRLLNHFSVPY